MNELVPEIHAIVLAARPSMEPTADELAGGRARLLAALAAPAALPGAAANAGGVEKTAGAASGWSALTTTVIAIGLGALLAGGALAIDRWSAPAAGVARLETVLVPAPAAAPVPPAAATASPGPIDTPPADSATTVTTTVTSSSSPSVAAKHARTPRAPRTAAPARAPAPAIESTPSPSTVTAPAPVEPAAAIAEPPRAPEPSSLSIELSLLERARRALRAADYPTARALLAEHGRRFPAGQLAAERARLTGSLPISERSHP